MATFVDDRYYRKRITDSQRRLERWKQKSSEFEGLRYVPGQLAQMSELPPQMEQRLNQAVELRAREGKAEKELATPTQGMYDFLGKVYGGMIYLEVEESIIEQVFPRGRPDPQNTPPEMVTIVLARLGEVFEGDLRDHRLKEERKDELEQLLQRRQEAVKEEAEAEQKALEARALLAEANQELDKHESTLRHLSRADNVWNPGIYRALFPSTPAADEEPPSDDPPSPPSDDPPSPPSDDPNRPG